MLDFFKLPLLQSLAAILHSLIYMFYVLDLPGDLITKSILRSTFTETCKHTFLCLPHGVGATRCFEAKATNPAASLLLLTLSVTIDKWQITKLELVPSLGIICPTIEI